MRETLQSSFRAAPWIDLTRAFRSSSKRERDPISSDMEEQIELENGGRIGRHTAQRIFVSAELDGEEPRTPFRQEFTEEDKKTIFWHPATRLHRRLPSSGDLYADWKTTPRGVAIFKEMQRARQEGDARRDEQERLQLMNQDSEMEEPPHNELLIHSWRDMQVPDWRVLDDDDALRWASAVVALLRARGADVREVNLARRRRR
jgi:hypothetical protein